MAAVQCALACAGVVAAAFAGPAGALLVLALLAGVGFATGRWWTTMVLPLAVAALAGVAYLVDGDGLERADDSAKIAVGALDLAVLGALLSAGAVALGVVFRQARDADRPHPAG